jgi:PIN domain nuclease of toxin-antitoxin system
MRYLLDTHILLWYLYNRSELAKPVLDIIEDYENTLYFSVASLHEILIKS